MGVEGSRRSLLLVVEPPVLSQLLAEVFTALGEDDLTVVPPSNVPEANGSKFSAALVSAPLVDESIADVVIQLPAPGEVQAEVRSASGTRQIDVPALVSVLDLLDSVSPSKQRRVEVAAAWRAGFDTSDRRPSGG